MTIEIKELVIKAVVEQPAKSAETGLAQDAQQALVNLCIEQVLAILDRQRQR